MALTIATLFQILVNVIAPVFIVIAIGFFIQRFASLNIRSISDVCIYAFTPCLVFTLIVESSVSGHEWLQITFVTVATALVMFGVSWVSAKALGLGKMLTSGLMVSTSLVNTGAYGLPVILLAFGQKGLELAVAFLIVSSLMMWTLGIFVASNGASSLRESLTNVVRLPQIYALLAAIALRTNGLQVPQPMTESVRLLGNASIPSMLIVLGMELSNSRFVKRGWVNWKLVSLSSTLKLLFPIIPVTLFSILIGLGDLARKVTMVQACMPTAITGLVLTLRFEGDSRFVSSVILVATLGSVITLTVLLSLLT